MGRKSFPQKEIQQSKTLQTLSANLDLIRRMEDLTLTEFAKLVDISDRHLDGLIRQKTNVSFLILEQIANRLGIPLLTLIGTRLEAWIPGAESGFLRSLQRESLSAPSPRAGEPSARGHRLAQEADVVSSELRTLRSLLNEIVESQNQIVRNQVALNKRLMALDALAE